MLSVENISRKLGARSVLRDVSFSLKDGSIVGLIGPGGGGKSTLLKILGKVARYDGGSIQYDRGLHEIGLMFQEGALFDSLNVFDNVAFPLVGGRVPTYILSRERRQEVHARVEAILRRVGILNAAHKLPGQLSGGMRRRVSLARALVVRPQLVLLDDPTAGLDPVAGSAIMELILEMHNEYKPTTLMVSQDLRRLLPVVDSLLALFDGTIVFFGGVDEPARSEEQLVKKFVSCRYDLQWVFAIFLAVS